MKNETKNEKKDETKKFIIERWGELTKKKLKKEKIG